MPLPQAVKVLFILFVTNALFGIRSLSPSLELTTTRSHDVFAEAFSPSSPLPSMTSKHNVELRTMKCHNTMMSLGNMPKFSLVLRLRRRQQLLSLQPLDRQGHTSNSRNTVRIAPILIASICLLFSQQPALAISLSNIFTASSSSIFGITSTATTATATTAAPSYHLTRILFLRLLAIVYSTAFSIAKFQNNGLIGDNGILPARHILNECDVRAMDKSQRRNEWLLERQNYSSSSTTSSGNNKLFTRWKNIFIGGPIDNFLHAKLLHRTDKMDRPLLTLLWLAPNRNKLNPWLTNLANIGLFLSSIMLCTGSANVFVLLGLWSIQRSFMAVGGEFYGYGWEMQLAELTFLAMFLVPMVSMNPFFGPGGAGSVGGTGSMVFPVPVLAIWSIRWNLFKIMMGAGLIKLKSSDMKWKLGNMSAMDYFYETQVEL